MNYVGMYLTGAFAMFALLAWRDGTELRDSFWWCAVWPFTVVILLANIPFVVLDKLDLHIRFVSRRRDDFSKWGVRRSDQWARSLAIRCPWFEVQMWNGKAKKEAA